MVDVIMMSYESASGSTAQPGTTFKLVLVKLGLYMFVTTTTAAAVK